MNYSKLRPRRAAGRPLYDQLVKALEMAIEAGELTNGERLPSERDMAKQLKLSRTTIFNAYRELESRGLVRSHVGRGTFVCARPEPSDAPFAWRGKVSAGVARNAGNLSLRHLTKDILDNNLISFALGAPSLDSFPLDAYQRATERVLKRSLDAALGLSPTEGQPQLRRLVASRFETRPERVLILSGSQQGLDLISRCLLDPGDTVIMDRPGYIGAIQTFRAAGANLVGWDALRADLAELEDLLLRYRPKLVYTDPTFQNPTGRVLPLRERQELLKLAARYRVPIIEDNPWQETYLDAPPPPTLYHLDTHNIVIHLSTFSKIFAPGLRVGWLVASEYIVDQLASIKQYEDVSTEGLTQLVLADLLQSGLFDNHLVSLRREHATKRDLMKRALEQHLPQRTVEFSTPRGGLHLWGRLNSGLAAQPLLQQALLRGVTFAPGEMFYADGGGRHELRLCFTSVAAGKIEEGVKRLAKTLAEARPDHIKRDEYAVPLV